VAGFELGLIMGVRWTGARDTNTIWRFETTQASDIVQLLTSPESITKLVYGTARGQVGFIECDDIETNTWKVKSAQQLDARITSVRWAQMDVFGLIAATFEGQIFSISVSEDQARLMKLMRQLEQDVGRITLDIEEEKQKKATTGLQSKLSDVR
jgi:hypothetical protein